MTNNIKYCSYLIIIVKYNKKQTFSASWPLLNGPFNHELCVFNWRVLSHINSYYFYRKKGIYRISKLQMCWIFKMKYYFLFIFFKNGKLQIYLSFMCCFYWFNDSLTQMVPTLKKYCKTHKSFNENCKKSKNREFCS